METLLVILCICVVARFIQQFYLDVKDSHRQKQYDMVCEQLRDSEHNRNEDAKTYRRLIAERDEVIKRLQDSQLMKFTYKQTPNGIEVTQEETEKVEEDEIEEDETPALD